MSPHLWNSLSVSAHWPSFQRDAWCMEASQICGLLRSPCMPSAGWSMNRREKLLLGQPRKSYIKAKVLALYTHQHDPNSQQ